MKKKFIIILLTFFCSVNIVRANDKIIEAQAHYRLGMSLYNRNNFIEAADEFRKAIRQDDSNYIYYYNLGNVLLQSKKIEESVEAFKNAIKYNPNLEEAYYNLGVAYYINSRYKLAASYFKQSISFNQYDIDAHVNLGLTYRKLKRLKKAIEEYQKALMIDGNNIPALINLGVVYKLQNKKMQSIKTFKKVLSIDKNNSEALYNLSLIKTDKQISAEKQEQKKSQNHKMKIDLVSPVTGEKVSMPVLSLDDNNALYPDLDKENLGNKNNYMVENKNILSMQQQLQKSAKIIADAIKREEKSTKAFDTLKTNLKLDISNFKKSTVSVIKEEINKNFSSLKKELKNEKLEKRISKLEDEIKKIKGSQYSPLNFGSEDFNVDNLNENDLNFSYSYTSEPMDTFVLMPELNSDIENYQSLNFNEFSVEPTNSLIIKETININSDNEQILKNKGLSKAIIDNILWYRTNVGKFTVKEDLLAIPGLSVETYNDLSNKVGF